MVRPLAQSYLLFRLHSGNCNRWPDVNQLRLLLIRTSVNPSPPQVGFVVVPDLGTQPQPPPPPTPSSPSHLTPTTPSFPPLRPFPPSSPSFILSTSPPNLNLLGEVFPQVDQSLALPSIPFQRTRVAGNPGDRYQLVAIATP
ncbi:hypothetical protein IE53DRAFT_75479 [Violaceomyces palustris]|uniref:Uncharacterized protein n=1 Tax=Violaceomyces palustris TaxID=1673888 RepID=A0ACD0NYK7_9BASI|nr:hypothetical protein IE53DRAFT_75479 [Violaceomyces palustris]